MLPISPNLAIEDDRDVRRDQCLRLDQRLETIDSLGHVESEVGLVATDQVRGRLNDGAVELDDRLAPASSRSCWESGLGPGSSPTQIRLFAR